MEELLGNRRHRRQLAFTAPGHENLKWPLDKPIPYCFNLDGVPGKVVVSLPAENVDRWKKSIEAGLKQWSDVTCLKFELNNAAPDRIQYFHGNA